MPLCKSCWETAETQYERTYTRTEEPCDRCEKPYSHEVERKRDPGKGLVSRGGRVMARMIGNSKG